MTPKQQRFCEEYLIDLNGTQAAIRAGYSAKTANRIASENLTKPDIQKKIQELQREARKKTEITRDEVLGVLASIIRSDVGKFFKGSKLKDFSELSPEERKAIESVKVGSSGIMQLKFSSKLNAVSIINKMLGFNEAEDINLQLENLPDSVLDAIIEKLMNK
jgi:phage terminase small subunit